MCDVVSQIQIVGEEVRCSEPDSDSWCGHARSRQIQVVDVDADAERDSSCRGRF